MRSEWSDDLVTVLQRARTLGFLGPGPLASHLESADRMVTELNRLLPVAPSITRTVVDLGSGGGVPGLVVADRRPDLALVLTDRRRTRTDFLHWAVGRLGVAERVAIVTGELPQCLAGRGPFDAVIARCFAPLPRTAGVAAALPLRPDAPVLVTAPRDARPDVPGWVLEQADVGLVVLRRD